MPPKLSTVAASPVLERSVTEAILRRYSESGGERYGINPGQFQSIVAAVVLRYAGEADEREQLNLVTMLHVSELALARACSAGNERAWDEFLSRFRVPLYEAAYRIAKDEATGRELADGLYADLYGMNERNGVRASRLDYYMGRGSLEGWLRTVLAQQYVDRFRAQSKEVSLEERVEAGASFPAQAAEVAPPPDDRVAAAVAQTLAELDPEERFLLASYYLDERTLADIGRQMRVHESTVSRKLERVMRSLRKRVRKRLLAAGFPARRCDELMQEIDVRDLNVDVATNLKVPQEISSGTFYKGRRIG